MAGAVLGLSLRDEGGGEGSSVGNERAFPIGEHPQISEQREQLIMVQAELAPPRVIEPCMIVDEKGLVDEDAAGLQSARDLGRQVSLQVIEDGDEVE